MEEKMWTLQEVAKLLRIPYSRIYYAHYAGRFPEPRKYGRCRLYSAADVDRLRSHFGIKKVES
jgi:DNA-binding transcriptional MerR regulator